MSIFYTNVSLSMVALLTGLLFIVSLAPAAAIPAAFRNFVMPLPRNYGLGVGLVVAATAWWCWITATIDLGIELTPYRNVWLTIWVVGAALMVATLPAFLTGRGLGMLMMLYASLMLDAGFLINSPWKFVISLLAYLFVIAGMFLVSSPYHLRDALEIAFPTDGRTRVVGIIASAFGVVLVLLGLLVYPGLG